MSGASAGDGKRACASLASALRSFRTLLIFFAARVRARSEVRFRCAEDGIDALRSLREVTTCSYSLLFASAKLCQLPEFATANRKPQQIVCYADDEQ